jgi:hypothetical protein
MSLSAGDIVDDSAVDNDFDVIIIGRGNYKKNRMRAEALLEEAKLVGGQADKQLNEKKFMELKKLLQVVRALPSRQASPAASPTVTDGPRRAGAERYARGG